MNWKWTAAVSGTGLVATWLGAASTPNRTATVVPAATSTAVSPSAHDIEQQAAHLQAAMRAHAEYIAPVRNPFAFVRHAPRRVTTAAPAAAVEVAPTVVEPARPAIRLTGIATDVADGRTELTAILSTASDLMFLKEGESAGGYTVRTIDEHSVELVGPDGSITLLLGNPKSQIPNPKPQ